MKISRVNKKYWDGDIRITKKFLWWPIKITKYQGKRKDKEIVTWYWLQSICFTQRYDECLQSWKSKWTTSNNFYSSNLNVKSLNDMLSAENDKDVKLAWGIINAAIL